MNKKIELDAPNVGKLEKEYLNNCIDSTFISTFGPFVPEFEEKFAQFIGAERTVSTQSGTAALHMALYQLGIGEVDEIIEIVRENKLFVIEDATENSEATYTYGPRQSARAIIPTIITQIKSGKKKINIGSIHPTRDLAYVKDSVNGFIRIAESNKSIGEVINIGNNFEISIKELINLIAKIMEAKIEIMIEEKRIRPEKSEVERLWADNTNAKRLLEWSPKYTLEEGLKETINWFSDQDNLKFYKLNIYNV